MTVGCEDEAGPEVVLLQAARGSVLPRGLQHDSSGGSADNLVPSLPFLALSKGSSKASK